MVVIVNVFDMQLILYKKNVAKYMYFMNYINFDNQFELVLFDLLENYVV